MYGFDHIELNYDILKFMFEISSSFIEIFFHIIPLQISFLHFIVPWCLFSLYYISFPWRSATGANIRVTGCAKSCGPNIEAQITKKIRRKFEIYSYWIDGIGIKM